MPMAGEVIVCGIARDVGNDNDDGIISDELTISDISGRIEISFGSSYTTSSKAGLDGRKLVHSFNDVSMEDMENYKDVRLSSHPFNTVKKTMAKLGRLKNVNVNVEVDKVQVFLTKSRDLPWCYNKRKG
jgi:hypothetical protein